MTELEKTNRTGLDTYSNGTPSHATNKSAVQVHLVGSELASLRLAALRSQHVERFLQSKGATLGPQSENHLRSYLSRAFMRAKEAGRWEGANPIADVRRRLIPKGSFDYLRREEVGPVLAALAPRWRPLFATAIYTGGRLGELWGRPWPQRGAHPGGGPGRPPEKRTRPMRTIMVLAAAGAVVVAVLAAFARDAYAEAARDPARQAKLEGLRSAWRWRRDQPSRGGATGQGVSHGDDATPEGAGRRDRP